MVLPYLTILSRVCDGDQSVQAGQERFPEHSFANFHAPLSACCPGHQGSEGSGAVLDNDGVGAGEPAEQGDPYGRQQTVLCQDRGVKLTELAQGARAALPNLNGIVE